MQNSLLNGDENGRMNLDKSLAYSNQKLSLPLLFVECQPNSKIKISQDDTKMHLKLTTDRKFALSDENYLFECMGLNRTNEVELRQMFPAKIIEYLNHEQILASLPRDTPKPPTFDMHMLDSIEPGSTSNGRKEDYGDNLLCKDERLNSLTSSTGKNSNLYTQSSAVRNPNSTPITKLCGQRVL